MMERILSPASVAGWWGFGIRWQVGDWERLQVGGWEFGGATTTVRASLLHNSGSVHGGFALVHQGPCERYLPFHPHPRPRPVLQRAERPLSLRLHPLPPPLPPSLP